MKVGTEIKMIECFKSEWRGVLITRDGQLNDRCGNGAWALSKLEHRGVCKNKGINEQGNERTEK